MRPTGIIVLDTETTGVEDYDQVIEIAYLLRRNGDAETWRERCVAVKHTRLPNEWVLENTAYVTRLMNRKDALEPNDVLKLLEADVAEFKAHFSIDGEKELQLHQVGKNPYFDWDFIRRTYGWAGRAMPKLWHHRLIDLGSMGCGFFHDPVPLVQKDLTAALGLPENKDAHTALHDCYEALAIFDAMLRR